MKIVYFPTVKWYSIIYIIQKGKYPPMERYYQPEIECASRDQIRAWQNERLVPTVKRVYENVPYYRHLMEKKGAFYELSKRQLE